MTAEAVQAKCEKCSGAGWLWGIELDDPSEDTRADTMTKYSCDKCSRAALDDLHQMDHEDSKT